MADNDDKLKISELNPALTLDNTSETVVNKQVSGSWVTFKMTVATLAAHILEVFSSSSLRTTNKTVVGAINELQQGGGGGGSSTLASVSIILKHLVLGRNIVSKLVELKYGIVEIGKLEVRGDRA